MRVLLHEYLRRPSSHNLERSWYYIHFADKKNEVLKGKVTWPKLQG